MPPAVAQDASEPTCGDFYDKWEVPGVAAGMLAMAGIGREIIAANDCVEKNDSATACRHWSVVMEVTDRLGPPYNQDRDGIEQMMSEHQCPRP